MAGSNLKGGVLAMFFPPLIALSLFIACGSADDAGKTRSEVDLAAMEERVRETSEINWLPFDKGLGRAKAENRPMLVDFTATTCGWCRKMDAEVFTQTKVIKAVNDKFVPVRVWGDSNRKLLINDIGVTERQLTRQAGVTSFPTFAVISPGLELVHQFKGYRRARAFIGELAKVDAGN